MADENDAGSAGDAGSSVGDDQQGGNTGAGDVATFSLDQWRDTEWRNSLSEEVASDASLADIKTSEDMAVSLINAQKLIGSDDRVRIPEEGDTDNWNKFYDKIGRPEDSSGYEMNIPERAPEGYESESFQKYAAAFRAKGHELGYTNKQMKEMWDFQQEASLGAYESQIAAHGKQVETLQMEAHKEFGDRLPEVVKARNNLIAKFGNEAVMEFVQINKEVDSSPSLLKFFDNISKALGDDKIGRETPARALSPREAKSKINAMYEDKNNPNYEALKDSQHHRHEEAVKELNRLYDFAQAGQ